ncbi:MAG: nucleotidyltransferase family protein [Clostridia bacterium]|nr:nucleotidyltransferase family protein [Clostridia bacterium]
MALTGIIAEFDPFHGGHAHLIASAKGLFPENGVVCIMSGGFTQRGAPSCADKIARAKMAVENGADIVFELPLAFALSPAPIFAKGGVSHLAATGILSHLVFGSESEDISALKRAAGETESDDFSQRVKELVSRGETYASAAASVCSTETAKILLNPNDLLAVEYIRALSRFCPEVLPVAVKRVGAAHGSFEENAEFPSASKVRALARSGVRPEALPLPQNVRERLSYEAEQGRFPLLSQRLDAAVLAVICRMSEEELASVPEGGDGLANRIFSAAQEASTVEELCSLAKSRNFTLARVRRCVWQAFLGITREDQNREPQYLRVLAVGRGGREILREMEESSRVPVITKPAALNGLSPEAVRQAQLEARADSLRSLALGKRENMLKRSPYVAL